MAYDHPSDRTAGGRDRIDPTLDAQIRVLEDEVTLLRRRLTESPRHVRLLEERLIDLKAFLERLQQREVRRLANT